MSGQFFKTGLWVKRWVFIIIANFILASATLSYASKEALRPPAVKNNAALREAVTDDLIRELLGEYRVLEVRDDLPFGYVKNVIDITNSPQDTKDKLKGLFELQANPGEEQEEYYLLDFVGAHIAVVRKNREGALNIKPIAQGIEGISLEAIVEDTRDAQAKGITVIDLILEDYRFFEQRVKMPASERMTLDYRELRRHHEDFLRREKEYAAKRETLNSRLGTSEVEEAARIKAEVAELEEEYRAFLKTGGLILAGGKGLSLSLMDGVVDVPPGFNVTTTAYFKFVRENPRVHSVIEKLMTLDTMNDQERDVVSREIREVMEKAPIPADVEREVLVMYRQLNIIRALAGKTTPTAVAVRSSGIKEDMKVESWLPTTTGSQAGQSDTFLNVRGQENVLDKLRADWASLFTDRAVSYRDDAIFLILSGIMGFESKQPKEVYHNLLAKLREYAEKLNRPEFDLYADTLTNFRNPGSVNLMQAMEEILKREDNAEIKDSLDKMRQVAKEFVHPEEIGIDVVIMQMVESYLSGVIFTVNPASKMAGVPQALYKAWYLGDRSLVYTDDAGNIRGTKPIVVSFEISLGYGENVVGGKVDPDKFVLATYDGEHWFILEGDKGSKLIQMINLEEAIELLKDKISEEDIRNLAALVGQAVSYDEVGMHVNGILATRLYGIRYLKELPGQKDEPERGKRERLQNIAETIAQMIKGGKTEESVKGIIKENFYIASAPGAFGIQELLLDKLIEDVFDSVKKAKVESEEGMNSLSSYFSSPEGAKIFMAMLREAWENNVADLSGRSEVLIRLGLGTGTGEFNNLSYIIRSLINNSFTSNLETSENHRNSFSIPDTEVAHLARMAWNIATYYKDQRDIEFAIEIDPSAPEGKRLYLHALDREGNVLTMRDDGSLVKAALSPEELNAKGGVILRLYNVQARPYTADHIKVDFTRARSEVSDSFIEEKGYVPIATGTQGENATHAYVLTFDTSRTVDMHAAQITRLKNGIFTEDEKEQLRRLGFNPDEYALGSNKHLPIALYLLEADPSHDPIMRLVDAVVTIRGGSSSHAAIFCREQGIPAVTAVGKVMLDGHLLRTGDGLTVDANNGRLYKLEADPDNRIPIYFVKFRIKPYGIPGNKGPDGTAVDDDGFTIPTIGDIVAATKTAQEKTPMMLAVDAGGNALTRAEFQGEELGINVFAGYGYDLIAAIKAGKSPKPERIYVQGLIAEGIPAADFRTKLRDQVHGYFQSDPDIQAQFRKIFDREYSQEEALKVLVAFDIRRDIQTGALARDQLTDEQKMLIGFIEAISQENVNALAYAYGVMQRRLNFDFNIIEFLEKHPWVLDEIEAKLKEKGYVSFIEGYAGKEFYYFYNLMGFTIAPDQKAKNRAYDFAQDKVRGLIGSEIFSWPGVNPLVGLRGASLEIEGVDDEFEGNQRILNFLLEAVIDANENTHNQAWFYVFVRTAREMDSLDTVLNRIALKRGKLPKQIGIMIEVPSDAMIARVLGEKLLAMRQRYAKYGVELVFFSFGTNDYSHLAGKGDREDPRMRLVILDPDALEAIAEMRQRGYFYDGQAGRLPLNDEGAEVMLQLIEAVVAEANALGVETSLCGEAITSLVARGDYAAAGRIMGLLKSFGVSMMSVRLLASMIRLDTMAATKEVDVPAGEREVLFDLNGNGEVSQNEGVIKGEVIYVDNAEDLVPDVLGGLQGPDLEARREFLKMQSLESARSTMRTFNKIVVITKNLVAMTKEEFLATMGIEQFNAFINEGLIKDIGSGLYIWTNLDSTDDKFLVELKQKGYDEEAQKGILAAWQKAYDNTIAGLERRGIDWDDLQYAQAIIVDSGVNLEGWDVFRRDKGIVPTRVKANVSGIAGLRGQLEGQFITIDYASGNIYKGNLKVRKKELSPRRLSIPKGEPLVETRPAVREDANTAYVTLKYHPLVLLAYEQGLLSDLEKIFDEYLGKIAEEINKTSQESHPLKKKRLLELFQAKAAQEPEPFLRSILEGMHNDLSAGKGVALLEDQIQELRVSYFNSLKEGIAGLLNGRPVSEFIRDAFRQQMQEVLSRNKGKFVVHTTTTLNSIAFKNMLGGFLVEQVNPNPDYGLLGAARAISDLHEINRLELTAFKEVRESMPANERNNFGLQITELRGTQGGAVAIAWKHILRSMGIIPGQDGLEIGVNISTPANTLAVGDYFEHFNDLGAGLSFVSYNMMELGAAWAGVDFYWEEWRRLAREEELQEFGGIAVKIIKGKMEEANKTSRDGAEDKKVVVFEDTKAPSLQARVPLSIGGGSGEEEMAGALNMRVEEVRKFITADNAVFNAMAGKNFNAFIDTAKAFQTSARVLIVTPNFFKIGGVRNVLNEVARLTSMRIAFYGEDAERLKILLGNKENIITAETWDELTSKLQGLKIESADTILLRTNTETSPENISFRQIVANEISTVAAAKAIKELLNNEHVDAAFADFFTAVKEAGVISNETYAETREALIARLQEGIFTLPELTPQLLDEVEQYRKEESEFMDRV